jgi:hypothetical protein
MNPRNAHLVTGPGRPVQPLLNPARDLLQVRHAIDHATLQVEPLADSRWDEVDW